MHDNFLVTLKDKESFNKREFRFNDGLDFNDERRRGGEKKRTSVHCISHERD